MEPSTNDILRDRGLALQAIACVDEAIWDVFGRALGLPLHRLWGSTGDTAADQRHRRLLPPVHDEVAGMSSPATSRPVRRGEVQGRREDAGRGRRARPDRAGRPPAATSRSWSTRTRATTGPRRSSSAGSSRTSTSAGSRSRAAGRTTAAGCATSGIRPAIPVCAGQSETTLTGIRDLIVGGAIDVVQLRCLVGRRADHLAQGRRAGRRVRRRAGPSRGAAGRRAPARERARTTRSSSASTRSATRSSGDCPTCRPGSADGGYTLPERPGFGIELDWDYVARYTVDTRSTDLRSIG